MKRPPHQERHTSGRRRPREQAQESAPPADHWPPANGNPSGAADATDEFSFLLRPSATGVGVFAAHAIRGGTRLRLYDESPGAEVSRRVRAEEVPGEFIKYCVPDRSDPGWVSRPADFGRMDIVFFLNHSDAPNAACRADDTYVALRDIAAGEEITIDYDTL
jgi:uncharacterized protein